MRYRRKQKKDKAEKSIFLQPYPIFRLYLISQKGTVTDYEKIYGR